MNEMRPFFSVIMPVYNGEKTIHRAVGSILAQTFADYEFIIVENGSSDRSLEIARAYAATFSNVRALHSEPRGVSHARNTGIESASGEYLVFLDADDEYASTALESMHDALIKCSADVLICGMMRFPLPADGALVSVDPRLLQLALLDAPMFFRALFDDANAKYGEFSLRHQCSRAYKREFLTRESIRFDERCPMYVDLLFNSTAYSACKSPYLLYRRLYRYNQRSGSIVCRSGAAFIADAKQTFFVLTQNLYELNGVERSAVIHTAFQILFAMIRACSDVNEGAAYEMLAEILSSDHAKAVVSECRNSKLHLLPHEDQLRMEILSRLRSDDLSGAIQIFKQQGGKQ